MRILLDECLPLGIVVLIAQNTRLETLLPLMPSVQTTLQTIQPGDVVRIVQ
jgi:hypothetical protein